MTSARGSRLRRFRTAFRVRGRGLFEQRPGRFQVAATLAPNPIGMECKSSWIAAHPRQSPRLSPLVALSRFGRPVQRGKNGPRKARFAGTSREPGTRLELVTPSLPWKCSDSRKLAERTPANPLGKRNRGYLHRRLYWCTETPIPADPGGFGGILVMKHGAMTNSSVHAEMSMIV